MNFSNMYYNTTQYTYIFNLFHETNLLIRPSVHPPLNNPSIYLPFLFIPNIYRKNISAISQKHIPT